MNNITQIIHKLEEQCWRMARNIFLFINGHEGEDIDSSLFVEELEYYDQNQSIITILETKPVTREEFRMITCEHIPSICEDSGQAEWNQGELDDLYDALTTGDKHIIPDIEAFLEGRGYVKKNSN